MGNPRAGAESGALVARGAMLPRELGHALTSCSALASYWPRKAFPAMFSIAVLEVDTHSVRALYIYE